MSPKEFQLMIDRFDSLEEGQKQIRHDLHNRIDDVVRTQLTHETHDNERFAAVYVNQDKSDVKIGKISDRIAYLFGGITVIGIVLKIIYG